MIPKAAVRKFINRERHDYSWYKDLTDKDIERRMQKLPVRPPIWDTLRREQKLCLLIGARFKHWCFWNDTGTGKSALSIALVRYFQALNKSMIARELVLVPNKVNKTEWVREIKKHSPESKYCVLTGSSSAKWDLLRATAPGTFIIETYAGFVRMLCKSVKRKRRKGKKTYQLKPDLKLFKEMRELLGGQIFDESESLSGHLSIAYRICKKLSWSSPYSFALNGTPFGRDVTPLWTQMHVIDKGVTLGETLGLFRSVFFREVEDEWGRKQLVFRKRKKKLLHQWIAHRSTRIAIDETKLPQRIALRKPFKLSAQARIYYDKALQSLEESRINRGQARVRKNEFIRLRQLSSGFLGYFDDEEGKKCQLEFPHNPKLEMCISLVQEIVRGYKVIIYHDFVYSGDMIARDLKKVGIPFARVYGKTKDPDAELMKFVDDDECRVFLLNSAAGGKGLNLQVARYAIYYESPVGFIMRRQTERRVVRQESKFKKAILYDLVMLGGVDERILQFHVEGADLLRDVLDGKVSLQSSPTALNRSQERRLVA